MDSFAQKLINNGQTTIPNYILSNFTKIGMTPEEFVVFLQIKRYSDEGVKFPNWDKIADSTGHSKYQVQMLLHQMIKKKLVTINQVPDSKGNLFDKYDFTLAYEKFNRLAHSNKDNNDSWKLNDRSRNQGGGYSQSVRQKVFKMFQNEFGRGLSPMEMSTVSDWLDDQKYNPKLIYWALRTAVNNNVRNLTYIGKILFNWDRQGIKSETDLQNAKQKRNRFYHNGSDENDQDVPNVPIFKI